MTRAVGEAEDLDLDVAGVGQVALEQDRRVAEEPLGPGARRLERARSAASSVATLMPMPPPPADALTITG